MVGVLIVEDDEDMRFLVRALIEIANDELSVKGAVASGTQALEQVDALDPEVIVLDQMMPGLSGIETAGMIRQRRPGQQMILCSAFMSDELRRKAEAVGIDTCLNKTQLSMIPAEVRRLATA